jgi:hypothetical protein
MSDPNERAAYIAELRAAERAEVEALKAEFIRKLEALYDSSSRRNSSASWKRCMISTRNLRICILPKLRSPCATPRRCSGVSRRCGEMEFSRAKFAYFDKPC